MNPSSPPARVRALLIVNPAARRAARNLVDAERALTALGAAFTVIPTEAPGHAGDIARANASGYDVVLALGGDGTAIEVISALVDAGPPVGILPGGTGNLLARALRIPMNIGDAVPALLRGRETRLDLGRLSDGRHFAIGLGVGIDEAMIANASSGMKRRFGFLAYFWSGMLAGLRINRLRYRLTTDGSVREGEAVSVLIANLGEVLGGLITLGSDIRPDDGLLHAIVFSPRTVWDAIRVFGGMLRGNVSSDPSVVYIAARHITLETTPPRRAQADGDLLGDTPLEIAVRPGAARLLTPAGVA